MRVLIFSVIVIVLDQASKLYIKGFKIPFLNFNHEGMSYAESIRVIGDFFQITFVENPGMAFGLDFGPEVKFYLSLFSVIASIGIFWYLYKVRHQHFIFRFSLAMIFAGAVGNLIDRVFYGVIYDYAPLMYGKVVDFLNVDFFDFTLFGRTYERWPIFNVADMAVTIGVILLILFQGKVTESVKDAEEQTESQEDKETLESAAVKE